MITYINLKFLENSRGGPQTSRFPGGVGESRDRGWGMGNGKGRSWREAKEKGERHEGKSGEQGAPQKFITTRLKINPLHRPMLLAVETRD